MSQLVLAMEAGGFATSQAGTRDALGIVLCIIAALAYSAAVVVQKPVLARVSALQVTWLGCAAATVACLPFVPLLVRDVEEAGVTAIACTVHLGIVPTAIAGSSPLEAYRGAATVTGAASSNSVLEPTKIGLVTCTGLAGEHLHASDLPI